MSGYGRPDPPRHLTPRNSLSPSTTRPPSPQPAPGSRRNVGLRLHRYRCPHENLAREIRLFKD